MSAVDPQLGQDESSSNLKVWLIAGMMMLVIGGMVYWALKDMKGGGPSKRQTVKIAVLPDTPPPPPPPPKEEKKPEPEKQENKPQPQQEQPKPVEAPPEPQQLKMDGPAGDGPSAFAAGAVTNEYKGGDIGTGTGGTVNKMQFALFSSQLQRHIQQALARNRDVKLGDYRVNVQVWLGPSGSFQRVELLSSSGQDPTDEALREALAKLPPIDGVPANLPQPLRLRITNRLTG